MSDPAYIEAVEGWRRERANNLSSPHGWLSAARRFWVQPGQNGMGSASPNLIRLPQGTAPDCAGSFQLEGEEIFLTTCGDARLSIGEHMTSHERITIQKESSLAIVLNDLELYVIRRGSRYGVRIFNPGSPAIRDFAGLSWFPIDESLRITARYIPLPEPQTMKVVNVLGDTEEVPFPGVVDFTLAGRSCQFDPVLQEDGLLWFMFRDRTNGALTYPGGRYLKAAADQDGSVELDFNKAYNPPCAYTEFATCPLPPPKNRRDIPVLAGEKKFPK